MIQIVESFFNFVNEILNNLNNSFFIRVKQVVLLLKKHINSHMFIILFNKRQHIPQTKVIQILRIYHQMIIALILNNKIIQQYIIHN